MASESLREQLMAVPGIDEAELEGDNGSPAGVRVRLAAGADPDRVGAAVREILAAYGMRSQVTGPRLEPSSPPPPPGAPGAMAPGSVVALPGLGSVRNPPPVTAVTLDDLPTIQAVEEETELAAPETGGGIRSVPGSSAAPANRDASEPDRGRQTLRSVAVEEGRGGVTVTATAADGSVVSRRARSTEASLDEAVVAAVAELMRPSGAPPLLVEAVTHDIAGTRVLSLVLDFGEGERAAGSSVLEGGRAYAVAQAAWAALSGQA